MKRWLPTALCTALLAGALAMPALAEDKKGHDYGRDGEKWSMSRDMYPDCKFELDKLGLSPEAWAQLEEKHFKLHTAGIRAKAELKVLKLQLARLLAKRDFDVAAATKMMDEIAAKKREVGVSHLEFLKELAGKVGDKDWEGLREKMMKMHMSRSGMEGDAYGMPDMHGMMGRDDRDDDEGGRVRWAHHRDCGCRECMEWRAREKGGWGHKDKDDDKDEGKSSSGERRMEMKMDSK